MTASSKAAALLFACLCTAHAQLPGRLEFDVASVRQNTSDDTPETNVPLTRGDFYPPNHGVLSARAIPLVNFIDFAWKLSDFEKHELLAHAPEWVATDRFNIEARSDRTPIKDQMRQMMQTLLAERFQLAVHTETRQVPIFGLMLAKTGALGPNLKPHAADDPVCTKPGSYCGAFGVVPPSVPGRRHLVGRDVRLQLLADELSGLGNLGRPVFDHTGLNGTFDFDVEYVPEPAAGVNPPAEVAGPTFFEAFREQLGLKFEAKKGPEDFVLVDHIEHPSAN